jgi:hypothetical protein
LIRRIVAPQRPLEGEEKEEQHQLIFQRKTMMCSRGGGVSGVWLVRLLLLLLLASTLPTCRAEDDEQKAPPEKGLGCPNLESIDLNIFVNPCDPLIEQEIPINAFDFTLYAALPPFTSGYCT